jgi:hydrogenase expression/formation protein HypC
MCVAAAGVVVSMDGDWAKVEVLGNRVSVHVGFVQPKIGDWVLVHAGYAMQVLTPEAAEELVALHKEIGGIL